MAEKMTGFSMAVGYWGRDPHCRLASDQTAAKIRVLLQDQLRMNGRAVFVWQPVGASTPGVVACTCDKNTTQNSDFKCLSCYGMRFVPGYQKVLHETVHFSSAEASSYVLTAAVVDYTKKPNRLTIAAGATTGVIVTQDKAFSNPLSQDWEVELNAFRKTAGDGFTLEYSTNLGTTYHAVTLAPVVVTPGVFTTFRGSIVDGYKPIGTGTLRFRITLARASGTTPEGPSFEIVRARHVQRERVNPILFQRSSYLAGQILILKTWESEVVQRQIAQGRVIEHEGDRSWTAPLDFFDISLVHDTPPCALDDREAGPHPFFLYSSGVRANQRYAIETISLDSTIDDILTHQSFTERRAQQGELYELVF